MIRTLPFDTPVACDDALPDVVDHLRRGRLIAYPTETVYGFGCLLRPEALERLAALKGGREQKPFLLLLPEPGDASDLHFNRRARRLAECFWPGPLTLALPAPAGRYHARVRSADGTVAVRVSPHPGVARLLAALAEPITSTSANRPGEPSARDAQTVVQILTELAADHILVLDGGPSSSSPPSTLVDCSHDPPRIVREGAISAAEIQRCLHEL